MKKVKIVSPAVRMQALRYIVQHVTAMTSAVKVVCDAAADEIEALERLVYVPGLAATGTVGARDTPGDKCPNCDRERNGEALTVREAIDDAKHRP